MDQLAWSQTRVYQVDQPSCLVRVPSWTVGSPRRRPVPLPSTTQHLDMVIPYQAGLSSPDRLCVGETLDRPAGHREYCLG